MRIFIFLLSLIFCGGFICLNILGFNGTLSQTEFILISLMAEVLLCLVLGHFMFRTYANNKRAKSLRQELGKAQNALEAQASAAKAAAEAARQAQTVGASKTAEHPNMAAPHQATSDTTVSANTLANSQTPDNNDDTTLFKTPFKN